MRVRLQLPSLRRLRQGWKPIRERNPVPIALIGGVLILIFLLLAYNAANLPIIGGGTTYTADFSEAAGLRPGNEVRVAGVKVGTVSSVALAGDRVKVHFKVKNTWVGNSSTVSIEIRTVLGDKYIAIDPLGYAKQNPGTTIPLARTTSPYDVTQAFQDLSSTAGQLNTDEIAKSLETLSATLSGSSPYMKTALTGLSQLSTTLASRDAQLAKLLSNTKTITATVASQDEQFATLLKDGGTLLAEVQARQDAIHGLLVGTEQLSTQLTGLISDDQAQLTPALTALKNVTDLLKKNRDDLDRALALAGPYTRLLGNTLGNGTWMDAYVCGLVPASYLPPGEKGPSTGCMPPKQGGN